MPDPISETAPAKVNLMLEVVGKKPSGFHELQTLIVFPDFGDELTWTPDGPLELTVSGPFARRLSDEPENLVMQAARGFARLAGKLATGSFHLIKNIPVAAGVGGGSADAAACIRLLARAWGLNWQDPQVLVLAHSLGTDVTACLFSQPCWALGEGEEVIPMSMTSGESLQLLLFNPGEALSTSRVFQSFKPPYAQAFDLPAFSDTNDLLSWLSSRENSLEASAITHCPAIEKAMNCFRPFSSMVRVSGTGATAVAITKSEEKAKIAQKAFFSAFPSGWCKSTQAKLRSPTPFFNPASSKETMPCM